MTLFSFLKYLALKVLYYTIRWRQVAMSKQRSVSISIAWAAHFGVHVNRL